MSIYRLLIHRFAVPLPSQGKAHEETQLNAKPQFAIPHNNQGSLQASPLVVNENYRSKYFFCILGS